MSYYYYMTCSNEFKLVTVKLNLNLREDTFFSYPSKEFLDIAAVHVGHSMATIFSGPF